MALLIEAPIFYAVDFKENSASVNTYDSLPEIGYVIEVNPNEDDRGNGYYPTRFFIDGMLTSWKTEYLEIVDINTS